MGDSPSAVRVKSDKNRRTFLTWDYLSEVMSCNELKLYANENGKLDWRGDYARLLKIPTMSQLRIV